MQEVNYFLDSLKSEKTKVVYAGHLNRFVQKGYGVGKDLEADLIRYLASMRQEGLAFSTRGTALAAIRHYYSMNDVVLNWVKIRKFLGEKKFDNDLRGYTHQEIAKLLEVAEVKYRAMILILASTGMRRGGLVSIRMKDMKYLDKYGLYQITVYPKTNDQYITFTTPEAARAIDLYLRSRREKDLVRLEANDKFHDVDAHALTLALRRHTHWAGIFAHHPETEAGEHGRFRQEIPCVHGLRKFAITQMAKAKVDVECAKLMTGHSIGVRSSYVKYDEEDLLEEYVKAIDNLTIDETQRLKKKVNDLEADNKRIDYMLEKIKEMEARISATF